MQVQMLAPSYILAPPPGPISVLASIIRNTGFRGLWLGQTGTLLREAGGGAAWFATKEYVARLLVDRRVPPPTSTSDSGVARTREPLLLWESAFSGACAGALYNFSIFPADSVKSAVQTAAELHPGAPPLSFVDTAKAMYRAGGIRGFYAGCGITVARAGPSSAIIFLVYDGLDKYFG
jgi:mitochondrial ornithine carrier protein